MVSYTELLAVCNHPIDFLDGVCLCFDPVAEGALNIETAEYFKQLFVGDQHFCMAVCIMVIGAWDDKGKPAPFIEDKLIIPESGCGILLGSSDHGGDTAGSPVAPAWRNPCSTIDDHWYARYGQTSTWRPFS